MSSLGRSFGISVNRFLIRLVSRIRLLDKINFPHQNWSYFQGKVNRSQYPGHSPVVFVSRRLKEPPEIDGSVTCSTKKSNLSMCDTTQFRTKQYSFLDLFTVLMLLILSYGAKSIRKYSTCITTHVPRAPRFYTIRLVSVICTRHRL